MAIYSRIKTHVAITYYVNEFTKGIEALISINTHQITYL